MSQTESVSSPGIEPESAMAAAPSIPAAVKPRRRLWGFITIATLVLLAGAIALGLQQLRTSNAAEAKNVRDIAMLKTDVEALNSRTAALERSSSEAQAAGTELAGLTMRLEALQSDVARAADRDTLAQLQDRIAALERTSPGEMFRLAAATLARANLARAAAGSTAFKPELDALGVVAPGDPVLAQLQPLAESGVPTRADLAARFPDIARAALDAERNPVGGSDFVARAWASMRRLVSVRRVGDINGTASEDRLARAGADLDRGDLENAVMEVRGIGGAAAVPPTPWLKDAEARLALDRAILDLNARIVQALATSASSPEIAPAARQTSRPANPSPLP
jgi:hypothetical protein